MGQPAFDFRRLSVDERLRLIGEIWDSIADEADRDPAVLPLTPELKAELDRRLAEHERDPGSAIPWDEALAVIEGRVDERRRGGRGGRR